MSDGIPMVWLDKKDLSDFNVYLRIFANEQLYGYCYILSHDLTEKELMNIFNNKKKEGSRNVRKE